MQIAKICLYLIIASIICLNSVYAVSIGVSPGRVRFDNLLQEGYAERTITITTNTEDVLNGHFNVNGEIKDWLSFEPDTNTFSLSKNNPYKLTIIIQPPPDVRNGNYSGSIEFVTDTISSVTGRAGGIVKAAVTMMLSSEVNGEEIIECRGGGFSIKDTEVDFPLELGVRIINDGNVRIRPTITLDVWDQLQENLLLSRSVTGDEVLPTTEGSLINRISHDLDVGQYWVDLKVEECNVVDFLTFSIVEKGGIVDKGVLKGIYNNPWATVGETVEFLVKFVNNGERSTTAKFKGSIRSDDEIVKIIETEEIIVPNGEMSDFSIFFTPEESGRYVLTGRVVYNKKLTFEKSSVLNVNPLEGGEEEKKFSILPLVLYAVIIVTIWFIARKIIKEKRKKRIF